MGRAPLPLHCSLFQQSPHRPAWGPLEPKATTTDSLCVSKLVLGKNLTPTAWLCQHPRVSSTAVTGRGDRPAAGPWPPGASVTPPLRLRLPLPCTWSSEYTFGVCALASHFPLLLCVTLGVRAEARDHAWRVGMQLQLDTAPLAAPNLPILVHGFRKVHLAPTLEVPGDAHLPHCCPFPRCFSAPPLGPLAQESPFLRVPGWSLHFPGPFGVLLHLSGWLFLSPEQEHCRGGHSLEQPPSRSPKAERQTSVSSRSSATVPGPSPQLCTG